MDNITLTQLAPHELRSLISDAVRETVQPIIDAAIAPPKNDDYLTRKQVCGILGVSLPTLLDWTRKGKVKGHRIGSRIRYKRSDVESSLNAINAGR
jgi:excisionase family DNA binding protein